MCSMDYRLVLGRSVCSVRYGYDWRVYQRRFGSCGYRLGERGQAQRHGFAGSPHSVTSRPILLAPGRARYRSGTGTTGRLRWPAWSTALTAKMTLSFESFSVAWVALPPPCACSHSGRVVARHNTSYSAAGPSGEASHVRVESFSKSLVNICTFAGGAGAAANDASVAAFSRATCAT